MSQNPYYSFTVLMLFPILFTGATPGTGHSGQNGGDTVVILDESFESGGFSQDAGWTGDLDRFDFIQENGRTLLQLNDNSGSSRTQIRAPSDAVFGTWEFYFRQNFTASNLNRAFIFLTSDREDLNYLDGSEVNGYALRTGENGDPKKIRLVRFDNGNPTVILNTQTVLEEGAGYRVKVQRSIDGQWSVSTSAGYHSQPDSETVSVRDTTYLHSAYFGLLLRYTSANTRNFLFDDFRIVSTPQPLQPVAVRTVDPKTLQIDFNRPPDPADVTPGVFQFSSGIVPYEAEMSSENRAILTFSDYLEGGRDNLSITGLCDRNRICTDPDDELEILIAAPASPGDVVINEIMYDPIRPSAEIYPGQSEYIELYNVRPYAVSLDGFHLRDHPELHPGVTIMEPADDNNRYIPAGGYLLLYPERDEIDFEWSRVARFFNLGSQIAPYSVRFERTTLSLPIGGREIVLSAADGTILDRLDYKPDWHNPNLIDTRGISLERVDPGSSSSDPDNWSSSVTDEGGTPGSRNSLLQRPGELPSDVGLTFEPNPFSPDGDGIDDHLFIKYRLDQPDYMLRVRIFDRYGRLVRNLANNQPAGIEGSLIWDGHRDDGQSNRIGIYIIFFEAYNSSTGQNLRFKETVVLARRL